MQLELELKLRQLRLQLESQSQREQDLRRDLDRLSQGQQGMATERDEAKTKVMVVVEEEACRALPVLASTPRQWQSPHRGTRWLAASCCVGYGRSMS